MRHPTVSTLPRRPPKKHTNLDTKPLTIRERFRLVRIRYLNLPNSIRLALVLLCITLYGYVTESFLSNVDRQDTQILVKYAEPRITLPPAFTICTHCVLCG